MIVGSGFKIKNIGEDILEAELTGKVDLEMAKFVVSERLSLSENKNMKLLLFINDVTSINREALKFLSREGSKQIEKGAIVVGSSLIANSIVNSFLNIFNSKSPIQIFKNSKEALKWLNNTSSK